LALPLNRIGGLIPEPRRPCASGDTNDQGMLTATGKGKSEHCYALAEQATMQLSRNEPQKHIRI